MGMNLKHKIFTIRVIWYFVYLFSKFFLVDSFFLHTEVTFTKIESFSKSPISFVLPSLTSSSKVVCFNNNNVKKDSDLIKIINSTSSSSTGIWLDVCHSEVMSLESIYKLSETDPFYEMNSKNVSIVPIQQWKTKNEAYVLEDFSIKIAQDSNFNNILESEKKEHEKSNINSNKQYFIDEMPSYWVYSTRLYFLIKIPKDSSSKNYIFFPATEKEKKISEKDNIVESSIDILLIGLPPTEDTVMADFDEGTNSSKQDPRLIAVLDCIPPDGHCFSIPRDDFNTIDPIILSITDSRYGTRFSLKDGSLRGKFMPKESLILKKIKRFIIPFIKKCFNLYTSKYNHNNILNSSNQTLSFSSLKEAQKLCLLSNKRHVKTDMIQVHLNQEVFEYWQHYKKE